MIWFQAEAIPLQLIVFNQPHLDWMAHVLIYSPTLMLDSDDTPDKDANDSTTYVLATIHDEYF